MAQNFDGGNIDEFDEFPIIRQYFPYQNFTFSHLYTYRVRNVKNQVLKLNSFITVACYLC